MRSILIGIATGAVATTLHAQPQRAIVQMTNFRFTPSGLELRANTPVILQLRNDSGGGHSFSAPEFFAAARLEPNSAAVMKDGRIEVPAHQTVRIELVPAAGQYPLKCTHALHSFVGMKGTIMVR